MTDRGITKLKPGSKKETNKFCLSLLQEVILQQANNTDNIYRCILEMCVVFTVTVDGTSAVALRSCLSLTAKDSHRAGSLHVNRLKKSTAVKNGYYYCIINLSHSFFRLVRHRLR